MQDPDHQLTEVRLVLFDITEHKQLEEAFGQPEKRLQDLSSDEVCKTFSHKPECPPLSDEEIRLFSLGDLPHPWIISPNENSSDPLESPAENC